MQMIWANSKTTIPRMQSEIIERKRLFNIFSSKGPKKLTIVRAPAGYGKTVLLSQWLNHLKKPVAWLTIDANDNEPIRFLNCLIYTISATTPRDIKSTLNPYFQKQASPEFVMDALLHEINHLSTTVHIVLDDFHLIENPLIYRLFTKFVDHLPIHVHLYVITRTMLQIPIARWRDQGMIVEIAAKELCFTYDEIKHFFTNEWFKENDLELILKMTEGWAAGIQFVKLSMDLGIKLEESSSVFESARLFMTEFLEQEILAPLPQAIQDFLICTSIVNELEPAICNVITGRSDSMDVLFELEKKGVFINRINKQEPIFCYHPLFVHMLQAELNRCYTQGEITRMYKDASTMLYEKEDHIAAVDLALEGQLNELANKWITDNLFKIFSSGHTLLFRHWVQRLRAVNYPVNKEMLVLYMTTLMSLHELEAVRAIVDELVQEHNRTHWMDEIENITATKVFEIMHAYFLFTMDGDVEKTKKALATSVNVKKVKSEISNIPLSYNQFEPRILCTIIGSKGKLLPIEKVRTLIQILAENELKERKLTGFSYGLLAEILYEKDEIESALKALEVALQYGHHYNDPGLFVPMYLLKVRILMVNMNFQEANTVLVNAMKETDELYWQGILAVMKAQCYLLAGYTAYAEQELLNIGNKVVMKQPLYLLVKARVLLATKKVEEALVMTVRVKEQALQEIQLATMIESGIFEAICHLILAHEDNALTALQEALSHGARYGYIRAFLDEAAVLPLLKKYVRNYQQKQNRDEDCISLNYAVDILQKSAWVDEAFSLLTQREQEVLQLLVKGASNNEIAKQLSLTEGTVRVYLTEIYGKIGVRSRTKAIVWAKEKFSY